MLPPPEGVWGMPKEMLATLPGYRADVEKNRAEARKIMEKAGLQRRQAAQGQGRRRATSRSIAIPAVILIDQLKQIYIDGELEAIDTTHLARQGRRARNTRSA